MVLSTANIKSKPWVSPVFYVYDETFSFYWVSSKDAVHSKNIRRNPQVAIVIFGTVPPNGAIDAVYIDAQATELEEPSDIQLAIELLSQRAQPDKFTIKSLSDVTDSATWRIYVAKAKAVYKRSDTIDQASGQAITVREPIAFEALLR